MFTPHKCYKFFKYEKCRLNNIAYLNPVYQELFKDMGFDFLFDDDYKKAIDDLKNYIKHLYDLKKTDQLSIFNVKKDLLNEAIISLKLLATQINNRRKNINGIESFCWLLLNITSLEQLGKISSDDDYLKEQLLAPQLFAIINKIDIHFFAIMISNLQIKYVLKDPSKRKGKFDKIIFDKITNELKLEKNISKEHDWLIDEKNVKKISIFKDKLKKQKIKFPDMVCKINNKLFIGAHKEQNTSGGAQDNQTIDVDRIFAISTIIKEDDLKKLFNIDEIYYVVIYDTLAKIGQSQYWTKIYDQVTEKNNFNRYIVNSLILKKLLNSAKPIEKK